MILRVYIPCLLVLYACVGVTITLPIEQCRQTYNTSTGRTCRYCAPGTHKHGDCLQDNGSALCLTCNANEYQGYCNIAESCATCDPRCLKPYTVKVKECTLYENILCECTEGRYWHKESGLCLKHDPCGVGMGMVKLGNRYNNTQCARCVYGETYSAEKSFERCQTCTRCHQYESNCTDTSDAVCLSPRQSTSPPVPTSTPPLDELSSKVEIIVAAVVPSALGLIVVLACIFWWYCRKTGKRKISEEGGGLPLQPRSGPVDGVENESTENNENRPAASAQPKEEGKWQPNTVELPPSNKGPGKDNKTKLTSQAASSNADQDETSPDVLSHEVDKRGVPETNEMKGIRESDHSLRTKNNNNTRNIDVSHTKNTLTSKNPQNLILLTENVGRNEEFGNSTNQSLSKVSTLV